MKKLPEIKELTSDNQKVFDVFNKETDLACVIIGASYIDVCLGALLQEHFISKSVANNLLRADGPLGNISARSDIAYCLNLISKEHYKDIRKIAEIRNRFAHNHLHLSFGDSEVQELSRKLTSWHLISSFKGEYKTEDYEPKELQRISRNLFIMSITVIVQQLQIKTLGLKN
ncbi:MAG: hypothetical protein HQ568_07435 [Calditrichaeota bacterium]|nr:hypothetical protein [Calditrichota bacterium]